MRTSVLIPSFRRGPKLRTCLLSLDEQSTPPDEVIVVWQADDTATRDLAESCRTDVKYTLRVLHSDAAGVVPAENVALDASAGDVILLIDDDAIAPPQWIEKHLEHYARNAHCGAVGGSANNIVDQIPLPRRDIEPLGQVTWYGRHIGNMYDHPPAWLTRSPVRVESLVGYNMSLRRSAFTRFEEGLRSYWQMFELDACFQAIANGFEVWFDFANVVEHYPTSHAYKPGREGDLYTKIYNSAFNQAFILSKFSPWYLRLPRMVYMMLIGYTNGPGLAASFHAMRRYGKPMRELKILWITWQHRLAGWRAGARVRALVNR